MKFEQSRPDHEVHEIHKPQGHGSLDQKHDKGMRSPITASIPSVGAGVAPGANGAGAPGSPMATDNTGASGGY